MVTVDGDCRVNKSEESKWLDWRGKARGEGGDGELRRTSGGIKLEENGDKLSRGWNGEGD